MTLDDNMHTNNNIAVPQVVGGLVTNDNIRTQKLLGT